MIFKVVFVMMRDRDFEKMVSVIIPTYNRDEYIEKTIDSCVCQTYKNIEILIIDDGSTDKTKLIVEEIKRKNNTKKKIKYFYQKNKGACEARNFGMKVSNGFYIQFLDSDDTLEYDKIKLQVDIMEEENTYMALCDFKYVYKDTDIFEEVKNNGNIFEYITLFRSVSIFSPLIRKDKIGDNLKWTPFLVRNQDMDFFFKYFLALDKWSYVPGCYCNYFHHDNVQISDTYKKGPQYIRLMISMCNYYVKEFYRNRNVRINTFVVIKYILTLIKDMYKSL